MLNRSSSAFCGVHSWNTGGSVVVVDRRYTLALGALVQVAIVVTDKMRDELGGGV